MHKITAQLFQNSDFDLIREITKGSPALFEILIRRYNPVLYKIARGYGFNHQDAEDLLQDTHVAAYAALPSFQFRSSYKTWASRIMINKCLYKINHGVAKKESPVSEMIQDNAEPMFTTMRETAEDNKILRKEFAKLLESSLQNLPLSYRSVFILREVEGFSVSETAELLGISSINVKVRLSRARTMLQKQLEQFYTSADIYEFNLVYCDAIVHRVMSKILIP